MQHARVDYRRIQDLAWLAGVLRNDINTYKEQGKDEAAMALQAHLDWLDDGFGPLNVEPIPMNMPVFLILAKDIVGPGTVRVWATSAYGAGADDSITAAAREQADLMEKWQNEHGFQVPDMPPQGPCLHCGTMTSGKVQGPNGSEWCCSGECAGG